MPIWDREPGTSPEAPGTAYFYEQGKAKTSGVQLASDGTVTAPGGVATTGDLSVDGGLTVAGFTSLAAAQTSGNLTVFGGALVLGTVGTKMTLTTGENATAGVATLAAGTVTVATDAVTDDSMVFLTSQADGGTPGWLRVSARTAAASFTITSSSATDTSTVAYWIVEPAA